VTKIVEVDVYTSTSTNLAKGMHMDDARLILLEAIARKRIVVARYNGAMLMLAPHLIFERRSELYAFALNLSKNWCLGEEKLGQFKLAGLSDVALQDGPFRPLASYDGKPPAPGDLIVISV
jgi:hypothetical protein